MTLATVGGDLRPSTRIVLVKGYDARGIVWYTNYDSRKGRELAGNPFAALQFHWVELERVVRIEGRVEKIERRARATPTSRAARSTRASAPGPVPQSEVIASRAVLVAERREVRRAVPAATRRGRRTGAATGWCRTAGSSGRAARAGCTTGCGYRRMG